MKLFKLAHATVALLALSAGLVQAAPVTSWTTTVDSAFDPTSIVSTIGPVTPPGTAPDVVISNSNKTLRWGVSTGQGQSGLDITNSPTSSNILTNGPAVANISVTHTNFPIQAPSLDRVNILSTLTLTPFSPAGQGLPPATLTFGINFLETPNAGTNGFCADGAAVGSGGVNANGCADIFVIEANTLNFAFEYDTDGLGGDAAETYFISFFEQSAGLNPLSAAACLAVTGSNAPCLGFETAEGVQTTVNFAALITSQPVQIPEPGSLALAGVALAGLAGLGRRRKTLKA